MADRKNLKYSSGWVPSGNIRGKTHAQTSHAVLSPSSRGGDTICRNDSSPSRTSSSSCDDFVQINLNDCDPNDDSRTTQSIDSDDLLELPNAGEGQNFTRPEQKQPFPASVLKSVRQANTPSVDPALALDSRASNPAYSRSGETVANASNKTSGTFPAHYDGMRSKYASEMAERPQPPRAGEGVNNRMRDAATPSNVDLGCELDGYQPETLCHLGEREDDVCDSWSMLPLQVELREVPPKGASQVGIRQSFEDLDSRTQRPALAYDSDSLYQSMPTEGHLLVDENRSIARNGDSWTELPRQVELGHLSPSGKGREGSHESFEDLETRTRKIRHLNHVPPLASMTRGENQKGNTELLDPMTTSGFSSIETVSSLSSYASDASLGSDSGQQVAKDFQECRDSQDKERVIQGMQPPTHRQKFFKDMNRKPHGQSNTLSNHDSAGRKSGQHCSPSGEGPGNVLAQRRHSATPSLCSGAVMPSQPPWYQHHHHRHQIHCHQGHGHRHKHRHHVNDRNFGSENFEQKFERETEKMKTKMMSVWNNMKYGWTLKTTTNFRYDSAIWLLGQLYHKRPEDEEEGDVKNPNSTSGTPRLPSMEQFKRAISSIIWFTYRRQFTPLAGTKLTTDCGWGCMLRSCQMMVAQALVTHFLGPDWDMYRAQSREDMAYHRTIITWFCDLPSDKTPFSIHNLSAIGQTLDKSPGDWYGPASAAHIFRAAMIKAQTPIPLLDQVCVYVAQDSTMYKQDVLDASLGLDGDSERRPSDGGDNSGREWGRAVILLIPVRLGGETINEMYVPCVQSMLAHKNCLGIIGGKPRHSLYFVGWQDNKLVYLDPHFCQDTVDCSQQDFPLESFHCMSPRKLPFLKMDPSCTIGFYCKTRADFETLLSHVNDMVMPPKQRGQYPLFIVAEGRSADMNLTGTTEEGRLRIRRIVKDREGRVRSMTTDSEDFIVLGQSVD